MSERRNSLIQQIAAVNDEQTLEMLEQSLSYYQQAGDKDITDGLSRYQMQELTNLIQEPSEKDTISEEDFRKLFARWGTK